MRWIIICLNKRLLLSYQELKTCKTETSESSRHSNQSGKRNLGHIMDPSKNVKLKHKAPVFYS